MKKVSQTKLEGYYELLPLNGHGPYTFFVGSIHNAGHNFSFGCQMVTISHDFKKVLPTQSLFSNDVNKFVSDRTYIYIYEKINKKIHPFGIFALISTLPNRILALFLVDNLALCTGLITVPSVALLTALQEARYPASSKTPFTVPLFGVVMLYVQSVILNTAPFKTAAVPMLSDVRVGTMYSIPFWMKELLTDEVVISNSPLLGNMRIIELGMIDFLSLNRRGKG
jgi:hypothetical protein